VVVCKIGQASPLVPLPLLDTVVFYRGGFGSTILLPVTRVAGAPLPRAVAADRPVFRIQSKFLLAAVIPALLLTRLLRACSLLRVKWRGFELPVAKTANSLIHPSSVITE
jgi:hypothetical protein